MEMIFTLVSCYHCCVICNLEPLNRIEEMINSIIRREINLFVLLISDKLNKCVNAKQLVEERRAEAVLLRDAPTFRGSRGGKVISNNGSL